MRNPIWDIWEKATAEQRNDFVKQLCSRFPSLVAKFMYEKHYQIMERDYGIWKNTTK